jgi:hypothetical protein
MLSIVASERAEQDALKLDLDALVREGARRMLLSALKAEVDQYIADHAGPAALRLGMRWWSAMEWRSRGP